MTIDAQPSYSVNLLNLELCEGMFENVGHGLESQADAIGEQQLKWTQSGRVAEADASGEQQLKLLVCIIVALVAPIILLLSLVTTNLVKKNLLGGSPGPSPL